MCELRTRIEIEWGYRRRGWCRTSLSRVTGCKPNRQNESYDKALSWMKSQQPWSVVVNYDVRDTFFVSFLLLDRPEPKVTRVDPSGASTISRGSICNCWHLEVWLAGALFFERMYHPWNNTKTDVAFKAGSFVYIWVEVGLARYDLQTIVEGYRTNNLLGLLIGKQILVWVSKTFLTLFETLFLIK